MGTVKNFGEYLMRLWVEVMAKTPSFIELNGEFITKPSDIANYFNNYFLSKVNTLQNQMLPVSGGLSRAIIQNHIMW